MSLTTPTAEEIRAFRGRLGLSQAKLAAVLGVSTRAVEEWEAGRSAPFAYLRLALERLEQEAA